MSNKIQTLILSLSTIMFVACEKVIDIDLNDVEPKIVVEANIDDIEGPYQVKLTKTVNYNQSNMFPTVSDAVVTLSDSEGNTEVLVESVPGIYVSTLIEGVPGRTYTLDI